MAATCISLNVTCRSTSDSAKNGIKRFNEYIVPLEHNGIQVVETEYLTDALSREAVRFVHESSANPEPFFLYLAYNAPHSPLEAKPEDLKHYSHIQDESRRTYAAMVHAVDRGVGELMSALGDCGESDNTLVIFLSDNGGKIGAGANNAPLSEGKGSVAEGGYRVPMLFHWPGTLPAKQVFEHPVSSLDFYPTCAHLAAAKVSPQKQLDGVNIWADLLAGKNPRPGEPIFVLRHFRGFHNVGIRWDQWKLSKRGPNSPWKLFDVSADLAETADLRDQHEQMVRRMVSRAESWSQTHTEPQWFDNPNAAKYWVEEDMPDYDRTFALQ